MIMDNTFTQTCHKSYDRHKYKLFFKDGKTETYEWYDEVTARWFQTPRELLRHIEVIDRKKSK
jgi:hypothetical protein